MSYTEATQFSDLAFFQWGNVSAPNPTLAAPLLPADTTVYFSSPPLDHEGNVIAKAFLIDVKKSDGYCMTAYIAAGAMSTDGLSATVVQGIRLEGLDFTTSDTALIPSDGFNAGDSIGCNISGVIGAMIKGAIDGTIASGGTGLIMGTEPGAGGETVTLYRTTTAGVKLGILRWDITTGKIQYSNDGSTWVNFEDVTASNLVLISATDSTPGYLNDKITVTQGDNITFTKTVINPGANESVDILASVDVTTAVDDELDSREVVEHETYAPAYLTGGSSATSNYLLWLGTSDGEFSFTLDGVARNITGLDFTSVTSMDDVAAVIQVGIRALTSSTETVVWSTDHFILTSADTTSSSAITVLAAVGGGTDISGVTASDPNMDADAGNGTVTVAILDPTADSGKIPSLTSDGLVDKSLLGDDYTAKGDLVVGTGANTKAILNVGSDGQIMFADSGESTGVKWGDASSIALASSGGDFLTSSGTTVVTHNLGKTPKLINFRAAAQGAADAWSTGTSNNHCIYWTNSSVGDTTVSQAIYLFDGSSNSSLGTIGNINSTTFTVTWSVAGSGISGKILWDAIG